MTLVCWILVDKYGLAIYNENRVKKRLSTYLDCGGLASVIFPTMKSLDKKDQKIKGLRTSNLYGTTGVRQNNLS